MANGDVLSLRKFNRRMKKALFFLPFVILIIAFLAGFLWWKDVNKPRDSRDSSTHEFLIVRGEPLQKIARRLEQEGLIKNELAFRLHVQVKGYQKEIKAGDYRLSPDLSLQQIILTLLQGPKELWVTYPEGLRREEIASRTIKTLEIKDAEVKTFWERFMKASENEEGYLFPDTYLFPRDVTAEKVVAKLRATFDSKISEQMQQDLKGQSRTLAEAIILASIIERETNTGEERPVVAGILLKRLEIGMSLQADATLQYVTACSHLLFKPGQIPLNVDCWWEQPTVEDKKAQSPYNTYLAQGLPPGPISNPGLEAIKAAIYPKKSDYLYYLHGKDGKIRYGRTAEEHTQNIQKFL